MIKQIKIYFIFIISITISLIQATNEGEMKYRELTPEEKIIIIGKGTEQSFTGEYLHNEESGIYHCKRCNSPLYKSDYKFDSSCGWPAFDDEIKGAIKRNVDNDGIRTEIVCANCDAHLGHIFKGEKLTDNNIRHCVNSISLIFIPASHQVAYFGAGCFWGVEHLFKQAAGIISTEVGYMGGHTKQPSYEEVCQDKTGHAEAVKIVFDSGKTNFEKIVKIFFEIHDFTQLNRQGPDFGEQYRSVIFYTSETQKIIAENVMQELVNRKYDVMTRLEKQTTFWTAEEYHQNYYEKNGKTPYCHFYKKLFE